VQPRVLHVHDRLANLGFETPQEFLGVIADALCPAPPPGTDRAFNLDLLNLAAEALRRERGRLLLHHLLIERPSHWHRERLKKIEGLLGRRGVRR
jgi:hypothetical protein